MDRPAARGTRAAVRFRQCLSDDLGTCKRHPLPRSMSAPRMLRVRATRFGATIRESIGA